MTSSTHTVGTGNRIRFSFLLGTLIFAVVVGPLLEETTLGALIQLTCLSLVFIAAVLVNWQNRARFIVVAVAAFIGLALHWSSLIFTDDSVSVARFAGSFLFLGLTAALLMRSILGEYQATPEAVLGAICIYLLLGLMWAVGYYALTYLQAKPFDIPDFASDDNIAQRPSFATLVYFSYVTMSTLGYGEIVPRTDLARTLAWTQSVTGQFYLAILVARLVSVLPREEDLSAAQSRNAEAAPSAAKTESGD